MADIYDASAKHMAALAADERGAASRMLDAWGRAWESIHADLAVVVDEIDAARAAGEDVNPKWLAKQRRLKTLQADAETALRRYARVAAVETQQLRAQAVAAAEGHARELVGAAQDGGRLSPTLLGDFNRVPPNVLELLVGNLGERSPLAALFAQLPGDGARTVVDTLIRAVTKGLGPRQVAREIQGALGGNLARALTIARTEQLRVYREASRLSYEANSDVVVGWRWTCAKDLRSCAACWGMDGTEHPVTERLDGHPNCRCAMIPLTEPGQTFGRLEDGPDTFAKLPPEQQRRILGSAKYDAFNDGKVGLRDFVGRRQSQKWGTTRSVRSLDDALKGRGSDTFRLGAGLPTTLRPVKTKPAAEKLTARQRDALRLIASNPDRVAAHLTDERGYLSIHGNLEHALERGGYITTGPGEPATRTYQPGRGARPVQLDYTRHTWRLTAKGRAALAVLG